MSGQPVYFRLVNLFLFSAVSPQGKHGVMPVTSSLLLPFLCTLPVLPTRPLLSETVEQILSVALDDRTDSDSSWIYLSFHMATVTRRLPT